MKIRTKVAVLIIITTICLCTIFSVAVRETFSHNFADIENDAMQQNIDRIRFAIDDEENTLTKMAATYSTWDETYNFVEGYNPDYIQNYFVNQTFINSEINVFVVMDNSGQILQAECFDLMNQMEVPLSEETLQTISKASPLYFDLLNKRPDLLETREGPLLFGTGRILTSQGEGPIRGTVLMGRFLDKQFIEQLSFLTNLPVTVNSLKDINAGQAPKGVPLLSPENPVSIKPLNSETLAGYFIISDLYGDPYLVAGAQTPREVYSEGQQTILWLAFATGAAALLIILIMMRLLDNLVLSRLKTISNFAARISKEGNFLSRVSLKGQDELTNLGHEMNSMLDKLATVNHQLSESENKYSTLVESSSDGIILIKQDKIAYANPRILQILGLNQEEFLGSPYSNFVNEKFRDLVNTRYAKRLRGEDVENHYEIEIDSKAQRSIPIEINAKVIELNHEKCEMVILRDITERHRVEKALRESEEKYRSLVNNIKLGIFRSTPDTRGRFLEINQAVETITGYSRDELLAMPVVDLYLRPEERKLFIDRIISTPQNASHDLTYKRKDHTTIIVSITASAVKDDKGNILYLDAIMEDITERKLMEEKINELYEKEKSQRQELEEEAQTRSMFIDILAHELRTPLTPIISATGMLKDIGKSGSDEIKQKLISNISNGIEKLTNRLEGLLELARYSRGSFTLNRQPTVMKGYLEDVIYRFKFPIEEHHQHLTVDIAENLPVAEIDPSRLEQVLVNLLSNACKYSPAGSHIYFKASLQDGDLEIAVKDEGIGITEEDQKKIFKPYHRVIQDKSKISGLGLGLTVSQKIVEAHGGTIRVTSQSGQGSTFSFRIPIKANK